MEVRKGLSAPLLLTGIFFIIYLFHSAPGIVFGDSAELVLASASLGIPHAPGYPLYSLLTHAFHLVMPFVEYAKACNIFSALISALSLGILFYVLKNLKIQPAAALSGCIFLGLSQSFFRQSLISEVYSLNSIIFITCLLLLVKYNELKDSRFILTFAFAAGIGMGNHHTMLAVSSVGFIYFFIIEKRFRIFTPALLLFIFGLTVYAYLPLRSIRNPILDFGDPETLPAFLDVLLRKQFGFGNKTFSWDNFLLQNSHFASFINDQFFPLLLIALLAGIILLFKKDKRLFFILFSLFCINGILTVYALNPDSDELFLVDEFLTPSFISGAVIVAFALNYVVERKKTAGLIIIIIALASSAFKFYVQRNEIDQSKNIYAYKIARDSLKILPDKAFIIGESDYSLFPLWYLQNIAGERKDVLILDADFLMLPWYQKQNIERLPVLKEVIPDISSHGKSGAKNRLDFSVLEDFKINQSYKLAVNVREKLKTEVFFTYDFGEMAKAFAPQIAAMLKPHGPLYYMSFDGTMPFKEPEFDLNPFLNPLNLPREETVFLNPYLPYLFNQAESYYLSMEFQKTLNILENIYRIDPKPGNAVSLALLLAETGTDTGRADKLAEFALKNTSVIDPKIYLVKGVVEMKKGNYSEAAKLLGSMESAFPKMCQPKLYLFETFLRYKDTAKSKHYYETIMSQCPDYYKKRVMMLVNNPQK